MFLWGVPYIYMYIQYDMSSSWDTIEKPKQHVDIPSKLRVLGFSVQPVTRDSTAHLAESGIDEGIYK